MTIHQIDPTDVSMDDSPSPMSVNIGDNNSGDIDVEMVPVEVVRMMAKLRGEMESQIAKDVDFRVNANAEATKAFEDERAIKRNRNRFYTLLVALSMTFMVPFVLAQMGLVGVLKYATGIAIIPDAAITAWAYAKRY